MLELDVFSSGRRDGRSVVCLGAGDRVAGAAARLADALGIESVKDDGIDVLMVLY